jgi:methylenetetrahydrofolate dehydrogenase (NADP+) / methenyltetrahydrofolate cyclohydrolase
VSVQRDSSATGVPLSGRRYAEELLEAVRERASRLPQGGGIGTVMVGDDPAADLYQRRIVAHASEVGVASRPVRMPADATFGQVVGKLAELDVDPDISGILVLRPLPPHLPEARVLRAIPPSKDIEAQHPENAGLLTLGTPRFVPSTPAACFLLLDRYMEDTGHTLETAYDGIDLVIVGRSNNVGKPAAILGLARNATVVSCHKHTSDAGRMREHTTLADVLIVAVGVPRLITGDMLRPGSVVIDVGINVVHDDAGKPRLVGDVDLDSALQVARAVSTVPGGVGPITDAWLLHNSVLAAERLAGSAGDTAATGLVDVMLRR